MFNNLLWATAFLLALTGVVQAHAQQTTTTTTATPTITHHFHPGYLAWKYGHAHPARIFQGNNIVQVPTNTMSNSVVNNCPQSAPVLLSTGQCITQEQAQQLVASGQVQAGGTVQTQGQNVIGTPAMLGARGFQSPYEFLGHFHQHFNR